MRRMARIGTPSALQHREQGCAGWHGSRLISTVSTSAKVLRTTEAWDTRIESV